MPYIARAIEEIDESCKRPIIVGVMTDLLSLFGLHPDTKFIFKGNAPQVHYLNSTANYSFLDNNNRYSGECLYTITDFRFEDTDNTLLNNTVYMDQPPIFMDPQLGVIMTPVYNNKKVTISANITGSLTQINRWQALIKQRTSLGLLNGIHTTSFHYPIPNYIMELLLDIHEKREAIAGYGQNAGEWLKECFRDTMTVLRTSAGGDPIFAIAETQSPIQGWFDFGSARPEVNKDDEISRYVLNFTYTFYCDIPEMVHLKYEYIVHNQLLQERWIARPPVMAELDYIKKEGSYSQQALNMFRYRASANEYTYAAKPGIPIPIFDDWAADEPARGYMSIIRAMVKVGKDRHRLMNYQMMGEWSLHPLAQSYMRNTNNEPALWYDNVIVSMAYHGDQLMNMTEMTMNDNLVLSTTEELYLRRRYHVVLTMLANASLLTNKAKEILRKNACFFKYWIDTCYPGTAEKYGWDINSCEIGSEDDTMTDDEMDDVIDDVTGMDTGSVWPLVGRFTLIARREDTD